MGINTGALYIIFIMLALTGLAYVVSGPSPSQTPLLTGPEVAINKKPAGKQQAVLQLYNFNGATITPPTADLCKKGGVNVNPDALIAYTPSQSSAVSTEGQISLWVSDTKPPYIAPNESVAQSTGQVEIPGDIGTRAPDGYLLEPQIYIFPQTVDKNGRYYFPDFVRGDFFNGLPGVSDNYDPLPPYSLPKKGETAEFIWNIKNIGLTAGEYKIQFVAHDGHELLGIRCENIRVYSPDPIQGQPGYGNIQL